MKRSQPPPGIGVPVTGEAGEMLGHVRTVYLDNATGAAAWAAVQGRHHSAVVPLQRHYGLLPDTLADPRPPRPAGAQDVVVTRSQEQLRPTS
jgi:hypothetical protein